MYNPIISIPILFVLLRKKAFTVFYGCQVSIIAEVFIALVPTEKMSLYPEARYRDYLSNCGATL